MLRSGRGKQLVSMVLNTAEGTEEETNKENQLDERQQVTKLSTCLIYLTAY